MTLSFVCAVKVTMVNVNLKRRVLSLTSVGHILFAGKFMCIFLVENVVINVRDGLWLKLTLKPSHVT